MLLAFICTSCAYQPIYLPDMEEAQNTPYGAYIRIKKKSDNRVVRGELLALDHDTLVVGDVDVKKLYYVPSDEVRNYRLQFSRYKGRGYLPAFAVSHGIWMIFTVPLNLIFATATAHQERNEYSITNSPVRDLAVFARYPEGLPDGFGPARYEPAVPLKN